jgi:MoxR-like ATPase
MAKSCNFTKGECFFCDREETNIADCLLLSYCLWTKPENREKVKLTVETIIEVNGFQTDTSLLELDKDKDNIEKEINKELFYSSDVYKTTTLKSKHYFKCTKEVRQRYGGNERVTFYIPVSQMKKQNIFSPIDDSGNELKWIRCEFKKQEVVILNLILKVEMIHII